MKRILAVHNDRVLLSTLRRSLRTHLVGDVHIETHSFAPAALDRARRQTFDAVIGDVHLVVMNGVAFLRRMAEVQPNAARILMGTATDVERGQRAPLEDTLVHGWLMRPWDEEVLAQRVADAVTQSRDIRLRERQSFFKPDIVLSDAPASTFAAGA